MPKIEENGKIVGYPQGSSFSSDDLGKIDRNLRTYLFTAITCNTNEPEDCVEQTIDVHATNFRNAKKALGYGSKYEEEWGDFAGILRLMHEKNTGSLSVV
jgi:hypothetical protein